MYMSLAVYQRRFQRWNVLRVCFCHMEDLGRGGGEDSPFVHLVDFLSAFGTFEFLSLQDGNAA